LKIRNLLVNFHERMKHFDEENYFYTFLGIRVQQASIRKVQKYSILKPLKPEKNLPAGIFFLKMGFGEPCLKSHFARFSGLITFYFNSAGNFKIGRLPPRNCCGQTGSFHRRKFSGSMFGLLSESAA